MGTWNSGQVKNRRPSRREGGCHRRPARSKEEWKQGGKGANDGDRLFPAIYPSLNPKEENPGGR